MRRWFSVWSIAAILFWLNLALFVFFVPWSVVTLPGMPFYKLAQQVWYVTFLSHLAIILSALAVVAASRVERKQMAVEEREESRMARVEDKVDRLA